MSSNFGNAVADYDLDGDLDIFIVAYNSFDKETPSTWSRLLENRGGWFEDVTEKSGFSNQHSNADKTDLKLGANWGDYNNDGYPDLLLSHQNGTQLYKNTGKSTFIDVTSKSKIIPCTEKCSSTGGLWWDFDNDGDLDLYLLYLDSDNRLLINNGDETFTEVEGALNLNDSGRTWSCLPIDANHDGWIDMYVVNDFGLSRFYINQEGKSFAEATNEYNLTNTGCGMGSDIGDYNNDGYFDIYVTNIAETKSNPLFMGTPEGPFINKTDNEGVGNGHYGWGTRFIDADNDGDQDIYVVNGDNDLIYKNVFFKNLKKENKIGYQEWTNESGANGTANGMGAEVFDFDNDGYQDILVSNVNSFPYLYRNESGNPNSWLQVNLKGLSVNYNAFGAKLTAYTNNESFHRLNHGATIMGQSIKPLHFGLGIVEKIDSLMITWPNGKEEKVYNIDKNQKITVVESQGMTEGRIYEMPTENEEEKVEEIQPETEKSSLFVTPNPSSEYTDFKINNISADSFLEIDVFSISGTRICHIYKESIPQGEWVERWQINESILSSGLYLYRIHVKNKTWTGKLVINH
ncbi:FG-GAP-like repeat-containing protein [uncultured Algibacter sp.]|uniref:FG-GAP-like repeat-containing protein n=1 Tax=uncultured Algibacter sp. TaxID=298659 RepID=UPI002616E19A|nr:FG-GAP-like repeat-containing protein [uncultured Algibacter sp.]